MESTTGFWGFDLTVPQSYEISFLFLKALPQT